MITDVTIMNFKSIRKIKDLKLKPLTIFTGVNSSGKSNIMEAIFFYGQCVRYQQSERGGPSSRYRSIFQQGEIRYPRFLENFIVFKKNLLGRSILWTGSFNFTHSARLRNQENVLILDNKALIDRYLEQFGVLKTRCEHYHKNLFKKKHEQIAHKTTRGTFKRPSTKPVRNYGKT